MKILAIGIHGPYEPWKSIFVNGQVKTWMQTTSSIRVENAFGKKISHKYAKIDQQIYYLRWSGNKLIAYTSLLIEALAKLSFRVSKLKPDVRAKVNPELGNIWEIDMSDSLMLQGIKNMAVFRESLNHEFDFLVTTITSSYINLALLEEFLEKVEPKNFLGGRIERSGNMTYQQGSFRVYSRDVVENLVKHSKRYRHWKIEDIAMGTLAASLYSQITEIPNKTLSSVPEVDKLTKVDLDTIISYRCKSVENDIRNDVKVMHSLHKRILLGR